MRISLLFYEASNPIDCDVWGVYGDRRQAICYLREHNWKFDCDKCYWTNKDYNGVIYILDKQLILRQE